jgi:hypothetical protein
MNKILKNILGVFHYQDDEENNYRMVDLYEDDI